MYKEDWIQIVQSIYEDMQQPIGYIPQGLLLGLASIPILWLCWKIFCRNRRPDWVRLAAYACCIVYVSVLLNMTFFSREPGSRTGVNLQLFGTWGETPKSRGYVIENIILFLPFGILMPCAAPLLRRAWCCVPAACLCSAAIEGIQFATQRGYCQLDDVVMNTVGAGVGWLLYRAALHRLILSHEKKMKSIALTDIVQ